jgi:hypothetical protein
MIAPLRQTAVLVSTILALAACGSKSGGGSASEGGANPGAQQQPKPELALKSNSVKKIMIGHKVDLRIYLNHSDKAAYQIVPGSSRTKWDHPRFPILKFIEGGRVTIAVTDTETLKQVEIKMQVVFDTTGIPDDLPGTLPELPEPPILVL